MELLTYLIKSAAILGLFYGVYWLVLRKQTLFIANRQYLIAGILAALILPVLSYTQVLYIAAPEVITTVANQSIQNLPITTTTLPATTEPFNWTLLLLGLYGLGVLICSLRFVFYSIALLKVLKASNYKSIAGFKYVETSQDIAPFSFFKYIVYNPDLHSKAELEMILKHEKAHASGWHSLDVLLGHILTIVHWLNPVAWWYKKTMVQNLEYLADQHTVEQIASKKEYQLALVKASTAAQELQLTNSFYQSFIKNRIVMLNTNQTRKVNRWKLLLVIPLLAVFMYSFNVHTDYAYLENTVAETPVATTASTFIIDKTTSNSELDQIEAFFNTNYKDVTISITDREWNNGNLRTYTMAVNFPDSPSGGAKLLDTDNRTDVTPRKIYYQEGPAIVVERPENDEHIVVVDYNGVTFYDPESVADMEVFNTRTKAEATATVLVGEVTKKSQATTLTGKATATESIVNYDNTQQDKTLYIINEKPWTPSELPKEKNLVTQGSITMLDEADGFAKYGDAGKNGVFVVNGYAQFVDKQTASASASTLTGSANNTYGAETIAKDITVVITSDMTRDMINQKQQYLKDTYSVDLDIKNLKYNADNKITGITINVKNKTNSSSYSVNSDTPIQDITLTIGEDGSMSVSDAGSAARSYEEMKARKKEMAARKLEMEALKLERKAEMEARKAEMAAMSDERKAETKAQMEARQAELALMQKERQLEMKARMEELKVKQKELAAAQNARARISISSNARSMATLNKDKSVLITATTTDVQLQLLKEKLASKGVDFTYKKVKRNTSGEITSIKIALDDNNGSKSSAQIMGDNDEGIEDIYLEY